MLMLMHQDDQRGELSGTAESLARICRCTPDEMIAAIGELEATGTAEIDTKGGDLNQGCHAEVRQFHIKNRRMSREFHERELSRIRKEKQRHKNSSRSESRQSHGNGHGGVPENSRSPSSSSSSSSPSLRSGERPRNGSRWPESEAVPDDWIRWAVETEGVSETQAKREAAKFVDWWIAQPGQKGVKRDWQATWRNWIRRVGERSGNGSTGLESYER